MKKFILVLLVVLFTATSSFAAIKLRRDTAANWTTNDPTLASGEVGIETDTRKTKIGNGSSAWAVLGYATVSPNETLGWVVVDSDVATAVADGKQPIAIPSFMNGMNLVDVTCTVADLNSAASGATTVVLRRLRGATAVDMTSTGVTIDYNAYTDSDETVDATNDDVQTGDLIFVDINAITTAAHKGLSCSAVFQLP